MRELNSQLLSAFDQWQEMRGFSPATRRRRRTSLGAFGRWLAPQTIVTASSDQIEEWIARYPGKSTRHAYMSDVSSFFTWAVRRRVCATNPVEFVDRVKVPKGLPRPVAPHLIPGIIAAASDPHTRVMIALAAYAGLRRAEIATLEVEDVALYTSRPHLVVRHGKGGKDRVVGLHPELVAILSESTKRVGRIAGGLSPGSVGDRVARHMRNVCGIDATCHQLRHTFATEFARVANGDLLAVSHALGHESIATTTRYVQFVAGMNSDTIARMYDSGTTAA